MAFLLFDFFDTASASEIFQTRMIVTPLGFWPAVMLTLSE